MKDVFEPILFQSMAEISLNVPALNTNLSYATTSGVSVILLPNTSWA